MIPQHTIDQVKQSVQITDFLASRGINPVAHQAGQYLYTSPLHDEKTPSFWVHPDKNLFNDFGNSDSGGDIIRLVQLLDRCDFITAFRALERFQRSSGENHFFLSCPNMESPRQTEAIEEIRAVKLLNNKSLIGYLESRCIAAATARPYVHEVYFSRGTKNLFAVGFPNDAGGYALRAGNGIKRNIGPGAFTTIEIPGSRSVNVFEGFIDFLSAMEYYGRKQPSRTTVILNSNTNAGKVIKYLCQFEYVNAWLDRDESGQKTLDFFESKGLRIVDQSELYRVHKDFNDFLTHSKNGN